MSHNTTTLEQEITALTEKWIKYINLDGHKDRDCHWYVQQYYSYGEEPYFQAYHWAYIGKDFEGSKCDTLEEAQEELRDKLLFSIHEAKEWLIREIEDWKKAGDDPEGLYWGDPEEYEKVLALLEES